MVSKETRFDGPAESVPAVRSGARVMSWFRAADQGVETVTGEVDSARCVGHLARLVSDLAPYRRRPAVYQLTEQATELLTTP